MNIKIYIIKSILIEAGMEHNSFITFYKFSVTDFIMCYKVLKRRLFLVICMICTILITLVEIPMMSISAAEDENEEEKTTKKSEVIDFSKNDVYNFEAKDNGLKISYSYGFNGYVKRGRYMPVDVNITSEDEDFEGFVKVEVSEIGYSEEVKVAKGESVNKTFMVPIPINSIANKIICRISDKDDNKIEEDKKNIHSQSPATNMIGILSDNLENVEYFGGNGKKLVKLNSDVFATNYKALDALDMIVVNDFSTNSLGEEKYAALKTWVNEGGILVLGTGDVAGKTLGTFSDDNFMEYRGEDDVSSRDVSFSSSQNQDIESYVKEVLTKNGNSANTESDEWKNFWKRYNDDEIDGDSLENENEKKWFKEAKNGESMWVKTDVADLTIENAVTVISCTNNNTTSNVIQLLRKSKGMILVVEINMGNLKEDNVMARKKLVEIVDSYLLEKGQNEQSIEAILQSSKSEMPVASNYIKIIVAYIIVLVAGYIVLFKKAKRKYMWVAIPAVALVFCVITFLISISTRVTKPQSTFLSIIKLEDDNKAKEESYFSYLVPDRKKHQINIASDYTLSSKVFDTSGNSEPSESTSRAKVFINNSEKKKNIILNDLQLFTTNNFLATRNFETENKFTTDVSDFNNEFSGKFKNETNSDLKYVTIVTPTHIMYLGDVKKGEEIECNKDIMPYNSKNDVGQTVKNLMGKDDDSIQKAIDNGQVTAAGYTSALVYYMQSTEFSKNESAYIIGTTTSTDDDKKSGFKTKTDDMETSGFSMYVKEFDVNYKKDGQVFVPDIRKSLTINEGSLGENFKIEDASKTVQATYDVGSNSKLASMKISSKDNTVYNSTGKKNPIFDGELYLFNPSTKEYTDEPVYKSGDGEKVFEAEELNDYVDNGKIKMKVTSSSESQEIYMPMISAIKTESE